MSMRRQWVSKCIIIKIKKRMCFEKMIVLCAYRVKCKKNVLYGLNYEMTPELENKEKGGNILC